MAGVGQTVSKDDLIFDRQGNTSWYPFERLRRKLGCTLDGRAFVEHAVLGVGLVHVRRRERGLNLALRPRLVDPVAFAAAAYFLADHARHRVTLAMFDGSSWQYAVCRSGPDAVNRLAREIAQSGRESAVPDIPPPRARMPVRIAKRPPAATLNQVAQSISGDVGLERIVQTVTDAATELSGAKFGAFFYNAIDKQGEAYLLYTLSGAPRRAFAKFGMPRNTALFEPTFRGTGIVRSADIRADPSFGKNAPHFGMPKGHLPVVSYLAVPVVAPSGEVLGGLFLGHDRPGVFAARSENIVAGIAALAAVAIDNARLYEAVGMRTRRSARAVGRKPALMTRAS